MSETIGIGFRSTFFVVKIRVKTTRMEAHMRKIMRPLSLAIVLFLGMLSGAQAALRTTFAAGYWTNAATWVDSALPQTGDDVTLAHAVTLDQPTPALNSFSNNAALTFVGWETVLTAGP